MPQFGKLVVAPRECQDLDDISFVECEGLSCINFMHQACRRAYEAIEIDGSRTTTSDYKESRTARLRRVSKA